MVTGRFSAMISLTASSMRSNSSWEMASRLIASSPQTCALLASTQEEPARVVVAATADLKLDCGSLLREALATYGLRGGGSPTMAQGQVPRRELDELFSGLEGRFSRP